jgi:hypothetical protein
MKHNLPSILTVGVCLLSAIAEAILCVTASTRLSASDILIVSFIVGPYLLLAFLAWWHRHQTKGSWALLALAVMIASGGLYIFGNHSCSWHTDPQFQKAQSMAIFLVPLGQWAIVLFVAVVDLVRSLLSGNEHAGNRIERDG